MIKDNYIKGILKQMEIDHQLPISVIEKVPELTNRFIKETISAIKFKEISLEEFRSQKKNFTMPGLYKLYASELRFKKVNKIK